MTPLLIVRRRKYASGFKQRLGYIEAQADDHRPVIWVHCVSVGETNAARPLIEKLLTEFPQYRIAISTTTATGQSLAKSLFDGRISQIFYFPYDWRFSVRRALNRVKPAVILVLETEIWLNFFRESYKRGSRVFIVNGRLSEKSVRRYSWIQKTMKRVLHYIELALMQDPRDAKRMIQLGIRSSKVRVTGNLKFDQNAVESKPELTAELRRRFGISEKAPLIIAASTHEPEEQIILEAFREVWKNSKGKLPRLLIAPRHPERFGEVEKLIRNSGFDWVKRTEHESGQDKAAEVILLDSVGELRDVYPLAEIVFVGGSLIRRGGQSVLEPAFYEKPIITGHHTENFSAIVEDFLGEEALIQLPELDDKKAVLQLSGTLEHLLANEELRKTLAGNALSVATKNGGATLKTIEHLRPYLKHKDEKAEAYEQQ